MQCLCLSLFQYRLNVSKGLTAHVIQHITPSPFLPFPFPFPFPLPTVIVSASSIHCGSNFPDAGDPSREDRNRVAERRSWSSFTNRGVWSNTPPQRSPRGKAPLAARAFWHALRDREARVVGVRAYAWRRDHVQLCCRMRQSRRLGFVLTAFRRPYITPVLRMNCQVWLMARCTACRFWLNRGPVLNSASEAHDVWTRVVS